MTWAEPDEVIDHRPAGACGCGADLALAEDLGVARSHQQLEVPLVTARRIQHDLHEFRCGCGEVDHRVVNHKHANPLSRLNASLVHAGYVLPLNNGFPRARVSPREYLW